MNDKKRPKFEDSFSKAAGNAWDEALDEMTQELAELKKNKEKTADEIALAAGLSHEPVGISGDELIYDYVDLI